MFFLGLLIYLFFLHFFLIIDLLPEYCINIQTNCWYELQNLADWNQLIRWVWTVHVPSGMWIAPLWCHSRWVTPVTVAPPICSRWRESTWPCHLASLFHTCTLSPRTLSLFHVYSARIWSRLRCLTVSAHPIGNLGVPWGAEIKERALYPSGQFQNASFV